MRGSVRLHGQPSSERSVRRERWRGGGGRQLEQRIKKKREKEKKKLGAVTVKKNVFANIAATQAHK